MRNTQFESANAAEQKLNTALVELDITSSIEEFLEIFDQFYAEKVELATDAHPTPILRKEHMVPLLRQFLTPLQVMAELGSVSVSLRYTSVPCNRKDEHRADWSLQVAGTSGKTVTLTWSSTRRWMNSRVVYERHSKHRRIGDPLTFPDLVLPPRTTPGADDFRFT
jgi:hypothetical protein